MKTKTRQRWVRAVVVSSILMTLAWGASAQEPAKSIDITTDDGEVLKEVIVLHKENDKVYLSYMQGGGWFSLDSLSEDARKQLGLPTREERWLDEAMNSLKGPNHEVSFIGPDGKPTRKESSLLTAEEQKLYLKQYVEKQEAVRQEEADKKAREEPWRDEAASSLEGPNHPVSFTAPDGKLTERESSHLTAEERDLYIKQYVNEKAQEAVKQEEADKKAREKRGQDQAETGREGPNHELSFTWPDEKPIRKHLSLLAADEKELYIRHCGEKQEALRLEEADKMVREEHWRHEPMKNLAEPNHAAAFLGVDGNLIEEASLPLTLTAEERKLYLKQYVEKRATVRDSLSDGRLETRGQTGTPYQHPTTADNSQAPQQAPPPLNKRPPSPPQ
jgi:hypothetical protein